MTRAYSMQAVQHAADRAVALVVTHLEGAAPGSRVHDVQDDPRFQHRGVDLLWERPDGTVLGVEVKGDRQAGRRGTVFLELVSNLEKDTPGCFLYSTADLLAYVLLDRRELLLLPLSETRAWFLEHRAEFPLRHTQTSVGRERYTTVGALVPVRAIVGGVGRACRVALERADVAGPGRPPV